jgi:hypothetical protein
MNWATLLVGKDEAVGARKTETGLRALLELHLAVRIEHGHGPAVEIHGAAAPVPSATTRASSLPERDTSVVRLTGQPAGRLRSVGVGST